MELIASGRSVQEVADYIGVDSLGYLSIAGLGRAISSAGGGERISREWGAYVERSRQSDAGGEDSSIDDDAAIAGLHREFCYGCMEKQGWPFDPIGATHLVRVQL